MKLKVVVLSGAGISAESGIKTFRDADGLWEGHDVMEVASPDGWRKDPSMVLDFYNQRRRQLLQVNPNEAHRMLVSLEDYYDVTIITQNIDGLHKKAGSLGVTEIHGSLREIYCLSCAKAYLAPNVPEGNPPYCECGGVLKPNTVLFGEQLPPEALETAYRETSACKTMLVIGTSAVVQPAASLPALAKQNGAVVIEVNPEKAFGAANYYIAEKAGTALTRIVEEVRGLTRG